MKLTICICTYNRNESLKNCIKSTNTNPIISSNKILSLLKENNDKTLDFINIKSS